MKKQFRFIFIAVVATLCLNSFQVDKDALINESYTQGNYKKCIQLLRTAIKDQNFIHYQYHYKLAACYAQLKKTDSSIYFIKNILGYFNSTDATYPITTIPSDFISFSPIMETPQWDKLCTTIKRKCIAENSENIDYGVFYDMLVQNDLFTKKINYFTQKKELKKLTKLKEEAIETRDANAEFVSYYVDKKANEHKDIKDNWAAINLLLMHSSDNQLKEKYLPILYAQVKNKNLSPYSYAMYYVDLMSKKGMLKNQNEQIIKDSIINSF